MAIRVGHLLHAVAPAPIYRRLRVLRHRQFRQIHRLARLVNCTVIAGPFAGVRYPSDCLVPFGSSGGVLPKLLGTYEMECQPFIEQSIEHQSQYRAMVNIGAGEGYYAVGMALGLVGIPVVSFEADRDNRELCEKLAQHNSVHERIRFLGLCTPESLVEALPADSLVICDCEGAELELLDPRRIPALNSATILVELHDIIRPEVSQTICSRFSFTHQIQIVTARPRQFALETAMRRYPMLAGLTDEDRRAFVIESRPEGMQWAFMRPQVL